MYMENIQNGLVPIERIESKILLIRCKKVMLDHDLAILYGVTTKALKQAVKRNKERFPEDFLLELSLGELKSLRSQIVTLKRGQHFKYYAFAFTEQGVAMLSSVLHSERAILVNIQIMRTFIKLRELLGQNEDLKRKIDALETRYDQQFKIIFDAIRRLLAADEQAPTKIGFKDA